MDIFDRTESLLPKFELYRGIELRKSGIEMVLEGVCVGHDGMPMRVESVGAAFLGDAERVMAVEMVESRLQFGVAVRG